MFMLNNLIGFGAGGGAPLVLNFIGTHQDTTNTPNTFSGVSLGEAVDRKIVIITTAISATAAGTVTVDGNSMSVAVTANNSSGGEWVTIWYFDATSATPATGDIVCVQNNAQNHGVGVYTLYNAAAGAPAATATDTTGNPNSASITGAGVIFGGGMIKSTTNRTWAWTELTEDYDETVETAESTHTGASLLATGSKTVTSTASGAGVRDPIMALATWGQ